jgi:hypothetical protein
MNFLNALPFVCLHLLRLKHTFSEGSNRKKKRKNCRQTKAIVVDEAEKP